MQKSSEMELQKHYETFFIKNAKQFLKKNKTIPTLRYAVEHIGTVGNHCLTILKLFEMTQDKEYIRLGIEFLEKAAKENGKAYCWGFSSAVSDIPPDADDTAIALLVFLLAKKLGLDVPKKFLGKENYEQFDSLIAKGGGVCTYFGKPRRNDVDPIANTVVAFLLEFTNIQTKARIAIRKYLNDYFKKAQKFHSEYYKDEEYFLLRCAKLDVCFPYYFSTKAKNEIRNQILLCRPKTRMQKIFIASAKMLLDGKVKKIKTKRSVFPETLFFQRTPFYEYGSQLENELFGAEMKELGKKASRHYVLAMRKSQTIQTC